MHLIRKWIIVLFMKTKNTNNLARTLETLHDASIGQWQLAIDTGDTSTRRIVAEDTADRGADAWYDALSAVRAGEWDDALEALETARSLADEWGDDGPERRAIETVRAALAGELASELASETGVSDSGIRAIAESVVEERGLAATLEDLREAIADAEEEYAVEQVVD